MTASGADSPRRAWCAPVLVALAATAGVLVPWTLPLAETTEVSPREQALSLYEQGRYAEAREILENLQAEGRADGPLLYRLAFCLRAGGDAEGERRTLERAIPLLVEEAKGATSLEPAFYLANAYANLDRTAEARRTAEAATRSVETGALTVADDPLEWFRVGKLHADLGNQEKALEWYGKAIDGFGEDPGSQPAYQRWALRYVSQASLEAEDFPAAEKALSRLTALQGASQGDFDRLAVARVRLGLWTAAREAWQRAEKANPARGDRARYSWRLCALAESLGWVPEYDAEGRAYRSMSRADLEAYLLAQAARLRELQKQAGLEETTEEDIAALRQQKDQIKGFFTAAGLEYAARGYPIRESAFTGGYAPLIFKERAWRIPKKKKPPEEKRAAAETAPSGP